MSKATWEIEVRERFIRFLAAGGVQYQPSAEDVVVDATTGRNFDFKLSPADRKNPPIALEVFRIFDDEGELGVMTAYSDIAERIKAHLVLRGTAGYLIFTDAFSVPKFKRDEFCNGEATKIQACIDSHSGEAKFESIGYAFYYVEGLRECKLSFYPRGGAYDPVKVAYDKLKRLLHKKNAQLVVQDHKCVIVIVRSGRLIEREDLIAAIAKVEARAVSNIDQIFFEDRPGQFASIF